MKCRLLALIVLSGLLALALNAHADDQANSPEARLRTALRNALLQMRTLSTQNDNLQAQVADLQSQKDELTAKAASLAKTVAETQEKDSKAIAVLKAQVSDQEDSIAKLQQSLQQWEDSQRKAVAIANQTETKRAKLAEIAIHLQRVVDDQKRKNAEMYKIGMEVLDRYEKFGLGEALTAKEPFLGIMRAKFETLVQDYEDHLSDATITSSDSSPPASSASTHQ